MVVIFSTVVIDSARREELLAATGAWLDRTSADRAAALSYELLVSPTDPSQLHFLQVWPDEGTFQTWVASAAHEGSVFRQVGNEPVDAWAVRYEGCTEATVIRPPIR